MFWGILRIFEKLYVRLSGLSSKKPLEEGKGIRLTQQRLAVILTYSLVEPLYGFGCVRDVVHFIFAGLYQA